MNLKSGEFECDECKAANDALDKEMKKDHG